MFATLESLALLAVGEGRYDVALQTVNDFEAAGQSLARVMWLRATVLAHQSEQNYDGALAAMREASHIKGETAETRALLILEQSRIGYRTNDRQLMRRLRICAEDMWVRHGDDGDVQRWCGPTLLNFANHALRNAEYDQALALFGEAIPAMRYRADQWCMYVRAHLQQIWCLCALGRPQDAKRSLKEAVMADRRGKHAADILLARSRIALSLGQVRPAVTHAQRASALAGDAASPDWQVIAEARYQELLAAVTTGSPDVAGLADTVRRLASEHRLSYLFRLVKQALTTQEEDVRQWGAL